MQRRPLFIARSVRKAVTGLNVVTAALDVDARTAGTEVRFVQRPEEVAQQVIEACAAGALPIVGWSFFSSDFPCTALELAWVKEQTAGLDALHVAGGVHASAEPEETLRAGFDVAVLSDGEQPTVDIVDAAARGADPREVPGTAHLSGDRVVVQEPATRHPLDDFPAFNGRYGRWNPIEITRGCVHGCSFCQAAYLFQARFRHRSVDNVHAHVEAMASEGMRYVRFVTPSSLSYGANGTEVDLGAVESLLVAVRGAAGSSGKIYFGSFPSEVRPEHVSREALALLRRFVDNENLVIGGQSGSQRVLDTVRRHHGVDDIVHAAELATAAGFRPDVDLILGLPGETRLDRERTLSLAARLVRLGARIHSHAFMPLPGTPLGDRDPEPIEPEVERAMTLMESKGAMYGQWRRHVAAATELTRRRRAACAAH
jgi:B12-binding domain/radical SAM domain protein